MAGGTTLILRLVWDWRKLVFASCSTWAAKRFPSISWAWPNCWSHRWATSAPRLLACKQPSLQVHRHLISRWLAFQLAVMQQLAISSHDQIQFSWQSCNSWQAAQWAKQSCSCSNEPMCIECQYAAAQMSQAVIQLLKWARCILTGYIVLPVAYYFSFAVPMYLVMCIVYSIASQHACCSRASCSFNSWGMWGNVNVFAVTTVNVFFLLTGVSIVIPQ